MPMSLPIFVVALILQVTGIWNDFLFGVIFAGTTNYPMTVQLNNIVNSAAGREGIQRQHGGDHSDRRRAAFHLLRLRQVVRPRHRRRRSQGLTSYGTQRFRSRNCRSNFGAVKVLQSLNLDIGKGEFIVLLGPSGCGKSTLLNCIAGLLDVVDRPDLHRRQERHLGRAQGPRHRHGVPVLRALSADDGGAESELRPARVGHEEGRDRPARGAGLGNPADRAAAEAQAGGAVGRPAPARRHRPGAGARRRRVPVRRAALQPRCQAALGPARRNQAAASAAQEHHDLRDARPDRGNDAGRPHRHHEERRHPAARYAARDLQPARSTSTSRASSARRR